MQKSLLVVDCQNDFIRGSLACQNSENAVNKIVNFINDNKEIKVLYSLDWHSEINKSFSCNGGIWPVHCVENDKGSELDIKFYEEIKDKNKSPLNDENLFYKGVNDEIEEYSAYNAVNKNNKNLNNELDKEVIVCGIASEYCVKETIKDLIKNNFNVSVYLDGIAYVNPKDHEETVKELKGYGIEFI